MCLADVLALVTRRSELSVGRLFDVADQSTCCFARCAAFHDSGRMAQSGSRRAVLPVRAGEISTARRAKRVGAVDPRRGFSGAKLMRFAIRLREALAIREYEHERSISRG
jgi:hypothetical protein